MDPFRLPHGTREADASASEAAIMAAVQKPLSVASFTDKSGAPAWKTIPSWYLVSTADQMMPPVARVIVADCHVVIVHAHFSGLGQRTRWIVANVLCVRIPRSSL
jgi:hypothetical protein